MVAKYCKCSQCNQMWNISVKTKTSKKPYICPECEARAKQKIKHDGIVTNVLIRNKAKFERGMKS